MDSSTDPERPLVIHYHLFKNAGTSVDATLRENFGATWATIERSPRMPPDAVAEHLRANPWITALSSHTATLPVPEMPGTHIVPIVFVRDPIDRARSIYEFEKHQEADTDGARMAKELDLRGFVEWRLDRYDSVGDHALADFQVHRLAFGTPGAGRKGPALLDRAISTLDGLPFVGLVEEYDRSIERLQALLEPSFPRIRLAPRHANVNASRKSTLEERLASLREELGSELYDRLVEANQSDRRLWDRISQSFSGS